MADKNVAGKKDQGSKDVKGKGSEKGPMTGGKKESTAKPKK